MKKLLAGCAVAALATTAVYAQETTSSIRGIVQANGAPVAGATVALVHVPSGTRAVVTTDNAGVYVASGLRPGGPYTVTVNASGFASTQVTDINTNVGQAFELPLQLQPQGQEIVVTASKVKGARIVQQGPVTLLNASQISKVASVNRDIRDLMRRDPFATLDLSSQPNRSVSFAGQNPRFNRFTIDGVPITDSFGLNPDALPSRRGPVPLDSIGTFSTSVAPYDIREGFFQGGVVNATLKSGTNEFHGTGFYTYNSDKLNGDRTKPYITLPSGRITLQSSKSQDYGATISGPIIKDRLFFMVSAERVRANLPLPNGTIEDNAGVPVIGLNQSTLDTITQIAKSRYGVDTGNIQHNNNDKDDRIVGRIDANITDTQRLALTGIYTKDSIITLGTTSNTTLATASDDYIKPDRVIAGVAQLNSEWSSSLSTETRLLYKDYKSGQTPLLANTAQATICTDRGSGGALTVTSGSAGPTSCSPNVPSVVVGPQGSSQANILRVKTYEGSETIRLTAGDHHFKALIDYQHVKNYDLFINPARGSYYFDTIDAFNAGTAQSYTYQNATTLNQNDGAAIFNYQTYTFGLQDEWKVNRQLTITYGARYDLFGGHSRPLYNQNFFNREGFSNQYFVDGKGLFQPRIGFNYAPTRRLTLRGGGGIFGGGTPDVYVANSFSASGVQPATLSSITNNPALLTNVSLTQIPAAANQLIQNASASANGSVSALDPNFKVPSQWRATLSATYDADLGRLGDHWIFGADAFFSKVRNGVLVQDYRNRPRTDASALTPDGRQRYYDVVLGPNTNVGDPNGDYVLTNSTKGRSWVGVVHFEKAWDMGLGIGGSFTYQNVKDQQALTSSIASSNYNNGAYFDPNGGAYGHANDEVRYSFKYNISFDHAFFGDYKTRIDLFGETRIGSPYSYTFQDSSSSGQSRSTVFGTVGSNTHYLFYVPTSASDPKVMYADTISGGKVVQTAAQTQAAVEALINSTGLKDYRGKVAPRNAFNSKWFTKIDLHLEQEIPTFVGHSRISVFADIENFLNLLNHDWGQQLRANFPYNKTVVQVACKASGGNTCAQYQYSNATPAANLADQLITTPSLYTIRLGVRFSF